MKKLLALILWVGTAAFAQLTSTINGEVVDQQGASLPGVVVSAESPNLQGTRSAVTNAQGIFLFRLLPPGTYKLTATMPGMATATINVELGLSQTAKPKLVMQPQASQETLVVTATMDPVLSTNTVSAHFDNEFVNKIASRRDQQSVAQLSPGVVGGFSGGISISGAPSHANTYLVNGVDSNFDNLRGGPANLVIEEAIQETTVLTSAISAEYGNFTGGIINSITKSGGNEFSGSLRAGLTNNKWVGQTPPERESGSERLDRTLKAYSATLGGPIIKDRIWFFGAFYNLENTPNSFFRRGADLPAAAGIAYGLGGGSVAPAARAIQGRATEDERFELKLTGRITEGHDLVVNYQHKDNLDINNGSSPLDESALWPSRNIPVEGYSINYRGTLTEALTADVLYSDRDSVFEARPIDHIQGDPRIVGTLLRDRRTGGFFNSAIFFGKPDEPRSNETLRAKIHYFFATDAVGTHDLVAGYEDVTDSRLADNRQSLNDWIIRTDVRWEGNTPIPIFSPTSANGRYRSRLEYWPIENSSLGSDLNAKAIFVNDSWTQNDQWSFNVGLRLEDRKGLSQDGAKVVDDSAIGPRLSAIYDLRGDGKHGITTSFSTYTQRIGNGADDATTAGSPGFARLLYSGPQTENYLDVINWVNQTYGDGFFFDPLHHPNRAAWEADLNSNELYDPTGNSTVIGRVTANGYVADTLQSPSVDESRLGYQLRLDRGFLKGDFIYRTFDNFYVEHINHLTGTSPNGQADLDVISNDDSAYERHYHAVQIQGQYKLSENFALNGNYTWSQLYGNIDGEDSDGVSGTESATTIYPEFNNFDNRNPNRYLGNDRRHQLRLFATYDWDTFIGDFTFALTERFQSGTPFDKAMTLDISSSENALDYGFIDPATSGYQSAPLSTTYYIDGGGRAESMTQTDLGVNWELPISKAKVFLALDVFNIFSEESSPFGDSYNTTVESDNPFNVYTGTPVESSAASVAAGTPDGNYHLDAKYGTADVVGAYQSARTIRFDVGVRF